ncbi:MULTISPECIES: iron-dicitrate ABC transporter permease FecC [unclassified Raoultella]|uniref:iron-dicitrate ABC transporter permease FecC n=1 Tax=unclassified Raoultella TaxID=2627600 RepID=UPI00135727FD|nr:MULTISPECIES: iron-dicitrate ABC transporter permease FecC [unclassified Raoultella]
MKSSRSALPIWGLSPVGLAGLLWLSLFGFSPIPIAPLEALQALLAPKKPSLAQALVLNLRLPRSLALSGALLQILTHNPLASPSLLGINSGAALAMSLTSAFSPVPLASYSLAFIAACSGGVSWLLVMAAGGGWRQELDRNRLILAGIALSSLCMALTRVTLLQAEDRAYGILYWLARDVSHVRWPEFWQLFPFAALIIPGVFLLANALNLLHVGDSTAHSLGVNLSRLRLTGACVSVAGPVAFIGLLVPHLARLWVGQDCRVLLPMAVLLGGIFMLLADILARALAWPAELPTGAVLALVGAPCFVWLVRRRG